MAGGGGGGFRPHRRALSRAPHAEADIPAGVRAGGRARVGRGGQAPAVRLGARAAALAALDGRAGHALWGGLPSGQGLVQGPSRDARRLPGYAGRCPGTGALGDGAGHMPAGGSEQFGPWARTTAESPQRTWVDKPAEPGEVIDETGAARQGGGARGAAVTGVASRSRPGSERGSSGPETRAGWVVGAASDAQGSLAEARGVSESAGPGPWRLTASRVGLAPALAVRGRRGSEAPRPPFADRGHRAARPQGGFFHGGKNLRTVIMVL